jgi:hypothetical protein
LGGNHAGREGDALDQGAGREGARLSGRDVILILSFAAWISGETITKVPGALTLSLMAY